MLHGKSIDDFMPFTTALLHRWSIDASAPKKKSCTVSIEKNKGMRSSKKNPCLYLRKATWKILEEAST